MVVPAWAPTMRPRTEERPDEYFIIRAAAYWLLPRVGRWPAPNTAAPTISTPANELREHVCLCRRPMRGLAGVSLKGKIVGRGAHE